MRHTVVQFIDSAEFGGTEQCLLNLLTGFDRRFWRVVLMYHPTPGLKPLVDEASKQGFSLRPIPRGNGTRIIKTLTSMYRILHKERPSVFHAHMTWQSACSSGLFIAAISRIPVVVATLHCYVDDRLGIANRTRSMLIAACVDCFIAVSQRVAEKLCATRGIKEQKVAVVQNGIPVDCFHHQPDPLLLEKLVKSNGRSIVLTTARLVEQKGLYYLLKAATQVPEAFFVVVGDGPNRTTLETQASSLGLTERVRFLGHRQDIPALLSICDLFVLPSLNEGLPLTILEAMSAGKPVISSAVGGVNEVIVNNKSGILVPPRDASALAAAIRKILTDHTLAEDIAAAGQERVRQKFTINNMVTGVVGIYEKLLATNA